MSPKIEDWQWLLAILMCVLILLYWPINVTDLLDKTRVQYTCCYNIVIYRSLIDEIRSLIGDIFYVFSR